MSSNGLIRTTWLYMKISLSLWFINIVHNHSFTSSHLLLMKCRIRCLLSTGDVLYPESQVKDLGISISSDLSWSIHINTMCARARSVAAWVLSAFKTRDRITLVTLYKSLVRSHLEYCCPLWSPRKITDIQLIEGVQRSFTSRIWGVQHLNYWERLKRL